MYREDLCQNNALFMIGKIKEHFSEKGLLLSKLISKSYNNQEKVNDFLINIYAY